MELKIVYKERKEHPRHMERVSHPGPKTLAGYNEVYRLGNDWFAYHEETDSGAASRMEGVADRHQAVAKLEDRYLFSRSFWDEKVEWAKNGDKTEKGEQCIRIGHVHFVITSDREGDRDQWRGMGGRPFRFKLTDGTEIISRNVWCQGHIPQEYWDVLPDNAEDTTPENPYTLIPKKEQPGA